MPTDSNTNLMLDVGDKIPAEISTLAPGKNIVLYFYPKDDTPGCTTEACGFRDLKSSFEKANTEIFGVSKDNEKSHDKFAGKYNLNFKLISDPDGKLCEAFGVWKEKSMLGKKYFGIERSTFLVDSKGKISKAWRGVKVSGHMEEVLKEAELCN